MGPQSWLSVGAELHGCLLHGCPLHGCLLQGCLVEELLLGGGVPTRGDRLGPALGGIAPINPVDAAWATRINAGYRSRRDCRAAGLLWPSSHVGATAIRLRSRKEHNEACVGRR